MADGLKLIINFDLINREELDKLISEIKKTHNLNVSIDKETIESSLTDVQNSGNSFIQNLSSGFASLGLSMMGLREAINMIKNAFMSLVDAADSFEQIRIRLRNLYGDAKKAAEVFEVFKEIAFTTPFEFDDVANAGVQLKAFGVEAEINLKKVADLAAYMGTSVTDAANAVGRAFAGGTGAAIMLRDRGILELIRSFRGIDDLSELTLPQFRDAMFAAFEDPALGIAGSTDRLTDSYSGAISNMSDSWTQFRAELGEKVLPILKKGAVAVSEFLDAFVPTNLEKTKEETQKSIVEYQILTGVLRNLGDVTYGTESEKEQFHNTIVKLNDKYGAYVGNLDTSIMKYSQLASAIEFASSKLYEEAAAKVLYAKAADEAEKIINLKMNIEEYRTEIAKAEINLAETQKRMKLFISDAQSSGVGIVGATMGYTEEQLKEVEKGTRAAITRYYSQIRKAERDITKSQDRIKDIAKQTNGILSSMTNQTQPSGSSAKNGAEAEDQTKLLYEKELELLILKKQNNYDVIAALKQKYQEYFDYLFGKYGEDSLEYQRALKARQDTDINTDKQDQEMLLYEKEIELLNLKWKNNYKVIDELQQKYHEYFAYLETTYGKDSLEYQRALNQKMSIDRDYALKQANAERERLRIEKETEQAVWDFRQSLLELEDPGTVRLDNQKRQLERFLEDKKTMLISAGITEKQIAEAHAKAIYAFEVDSLNRRLQAHASGLATMAGNIAQLGKKGFQASKIINIAQIVMETPAAAMAAYRSVVGIPVVGPALAQVAFAAAVATGLAQMKAVAAAKPPQAKEGGLTGLLSGPSHQEGGIMIEAEGNEFIVKKSRVKELGVEFLNFLNDAPWFYLRTMLPRRLPGLAHRAPSPVMAAGGLVRVGSSNNADWIQEFRDLKNQLVSEMAALKDSYEKKQFVVQNVISANEIVRKADPVLISYSNSKGNAIRSQI
ncbi:MAG: hypothetical protein WC965_11815 [Thiohalomonadaceae bacterium]